MKNKIFSFLITLLIFTIIISIIIIICLIPEIGKYIAYIVGSFCIIYLFKEVFKYILKQLNNKSYGRSSK